VDTLPAHLGTSLRQRLSRMGPALRTIWPQISVAFLIDLRLISASCGPAHELDFLPSSRVAKLATFLQTNGHLDRPGSPSLHL